MDKVLILTNEYIPFNGGISRYVDMLIKHRPSNIKVDVVCPDYDGAVVPSIKDVELIRYKGGKFKKKDFLSMAFIMLSAIKRKKYDQIIVADWPFLFLIGFLNRYLRMGIEYKAVIYGSEILNFKNGKVSRYFDYFSGFKGMGSWVAISKYTSRIAKEKYPSLIKLKNKVVYLGVEDKWFGLRSKVIDKKFRIITVGRIDSRKGQDLVIEAISKSKYKNEIVYTIVGKGDEIFESQILSLAKEKSVDVNILKDVSDEGLKILYGESDLFALFGREEKTKVEGFGLVLIEAAASGIPLLAKNVGAVSEVVNSQVGICFLGDGVNELDSMIDNRSYWESMEKEIVGYAKTFSWSRTSMLTFIDE